MKNLDSHCRVDGASRNVQLGRGEDEVSFGIWDFWNARQRMFEGNGKGIVNELGNMPDADLDMTTEATQRSWCHWRVSAHKRSCGDANSDIPYQIKKVVENSASVSAVLSSRHPFPFFFPQDLGVNVDVVRVLRVSRQHRSQ
jgi:hypothetical protein